MKDLPRIEFSDFFLGRRSKVSDPFFTRGKNLNVLRKDSKSEVRSFLCFVLEDLYSCCEFHESSFIFVLQRNYYVRNVLSFSAVVNFFRIESCCYDHLIGKHKKKQFLKIRFHQSFLHLHLLKSKNWRNKILLLFSSLAESEPKWDQLLHHLPVPNRNLIRFPSFHRKSHTNVRNHSYLFNLTKFFFITFRVFLKVQAQINYDLIFRFHFMDKLKRIEFFPTKEGPQIGKSFLICCVSKLCHFNFVSCVFNFTAGFQK